MRKIGTPSSSAEAEKASLEKLTSYIKAQLQAAFRLVGPISVAGFINSKVIKSELSTAIALAEKGDIDTLATFIKGLNPSLISTSEAAHEWISAHGIMLVHLGLESEIYDFLEKVSNRLKLSKLTTLYKTLAFRYYETGNSHRARFYLESVLEHKPDDLEAHKLMVWITNNIAPGDQKKQQEFKHKAVKLRDQKVRENRDKVKGVVSAKGDKKSPDSDSAPKLKEEENKNAIQYLKRRQSEIEFKHPLETYEKNFPKACLSLRKAAEAGDIATLSKESPSILKKVTPDEKRRFGHWFNAYLLKQFMEDSEKGMVLYPFFADNLKSSGFPRRGGQKINRKKRQKSKSGQEILMTNISKACKNQFFEHLIRKEYANADGIYEFMERKHPQLIPGVWSHAELSSAVVQLLNLDDFERAINLYAIAKRDLGEGLRNRIKESLKSKIFGLIDTKRSDDLLLLFELVNNHCLEDLQSGPIEALFRYFSGRKKYRKHPLYPEIMKAKVKLLWRNRRYDEAKQLINKVLRKNTSDTEALRYLFDIFLMARDIIACRKIHEAMAHSSPEEIEAREEKIIDLEETIKRFGTRARDRKSGIRNNPIWGGKMRSPISRFAGKGITRGTDEEEDEESEG